MGFRNVFISSSAKLTTKNNQLVVSQNEDVSLPIEDISTILIESQQVNLSSALMSSLGENGVCTFFCDKKHMPNTVLTPFNSHSRKLKILQSQLNIKKPLQKTMWQQIVIQKVKNQAEVLKLCSINGYNKILDISNKVLSDDSTNMEAVAASKYFKFLFGNDFTRAYDNLTNARLNYGYAILRGVVARNIVVYGLEPCLGLHHKSQLNAFNLADDLIEPFRPIVDLCVFSMKDENNSGTLSTKDKQVLFNLLNCDIISDNQIHSLSYAIERTIQSYSSSLQENQIKLKLCSIIPLTQHQYE